MSLKDLKRQNEFLQELSGVTVEMFHQADVNDLFQKIAERLLELSGASQAYIALEHESGEYAELKYSASTHHHKSPDRLYPNHGIGGTALAENRTVIISDYQQFANRIDSFSTISKACAIPIGSTQTQQIEDPLDVSVETIFTLTRKGPIVRRQIMHRLGRVMIQVRRISHAIFRGHVPIVTNVILRSGDALIVRRNHEVLT